MVVLDWTSKVRDETSCLLAGRFFPNVMVMGTTGERWRRRATGHAVEPRGRMTKRQELVLFVCLMIVLLGLIAYGLRA